MSRILYINYVVTQGIRGKDYKPVTLAGFITYVDAVEFVAARLKMSPGLRFEVLAVKWQRVEVEIDG